MNHEDFDNQDIFQQYNDVVTPYEIQAMLGLGKNSVYKLLKDNTLKNRRIGSKYIVAKSSVIEFLMSQDVSR